jgi:hypothetical protein
MDEFIRELTHDNNVFQNQWNEINKYSQMSIFNDSKTVLNALVDEPNDRLPCSIKFDFISQFRSQILFKYLHVFLINIKMDVGIYILLK